MKRDMSRIPLIRNILLFAIFIILFAAATPRAQNISGELPPNDDGSSSLIPLGFTFRFYGTDYNALYVNNNGNVTFNGGLSTYTPFAFPSNFGTPMIAPFFADVDTRNGKGRVYYTGTGEYFKVVWENVGYYDAFNTNNPDYRNTFSLTLQKNNGIIFEYGSMVWTTGDASGGQQGYGGAAATLGIDRSNGVDAVPFRRYGDSSVSALNGTQWYFQTDKAELNTPLFKQFTVPWGGDLTLNSASDLMKNTGCFVTSTAMVLQSLGHNTDPGKLNEYLRNSPAPYNMLGGSLNFGNINPDTLFYGQTDNVPGPKLRFRSSGFIIVPSPGPLPPEGDVNLKAQIVNQLAAAIDRLGSVILRVPSRNWGMNGYGTTHTHAIVAYKVTSGGGVLIRDPGWNGSPGTLDDYVDFVNAYVSGPQKNHPEWQLTNADGQIGGHDFSWLSDKAFTYSDILTPFKKQIIQGQVNSPVEIVITDPLGRRLGQNPVTGMVYNEIPDSVYFREMEAAPADDNVQSLPLVGHMPIMFEIGDYIEGNYKVEVFGTGAGPWSISFGVSDPILGFNPAQYQLLGVASSNSYRTFNVPVTLQGHIEDKTPPEATSSLSLDVLWPPNHRMVEVEIRIRARDDASAPEALNLDHVYISSSEPDNGVADGDMTGDINGHDGFVQPLNVTGLFGNPSQTSDGQIEFVGKVLLRAERSGRGQGRIYTIEAAISDQVGNVGIRRSVVVVLDNKGLNVNDANATAAVYGVSEPARQLFEVNRSVKYPKRRN